MSLDRNLFTLLLTPNNDASDPAGTVVDLTDPTGTVHYRKRRIPGQVYRVELYDPISEVLLASATAPSATSKHKTLELYNPSKVVELKFTGTLTFRWSFKWEEHEFEWRREECFIIRKPDPPVLVAVTKEPPGRIKTASVQVLDYNLNRFDIEDRKGLEIIILFALLTFQDASDAYHEPTSPPGNTPTPSTSQPVLKALTDMSPWKSSGNSSKPPTPPPKPPKPAPKKGVARIAELQQGRGEVNEVYVVEEGAIKDYATYCGQLLQDDAMLFVSIRSADAAQVSKVIQVVEETKRIRHKAGDEDLHQYVLYDTDKPPGQQKGPRIINLDDAKSKSKEYTPPNSLIVHLSKIDMPELRPRGVSVSESYPPGRGNTKKDRKAKDKTKTKEKDKSKEKQLKLKSPPFTTTTIPQPRSPGHGNNGQAKLHRPRSAQHLHTYSYPSSPSPLQLNNPGFYPTPPPPPPQPTLRPSARRDGGPAYRQSMYGSLNAIYDRQPDAGPTGLFGRLLGGR